MLLTRSPLPPQFLLPAWSPQQLAHFLQRAYSTDTSHQSPSPRPSRKPIPKFETIGEDGQLEIRKLMALRIRKLIPADTEESGKWNRVLEARALAQHIYKRRTSRLKLEKSFRPAPPASFSAQRLVGVEGIGRSKAQIDENHQAATSGKVRGSVRAKKVDSEARKPRDGPRSLGLESKPLGKKDIQNTSPKPEERNVSESSIIPLRPKILEDWKSKITEQEALHRTEEPEKKGLIEDIKYPPDDGQHTTWKQRSLLPRKEIRLTMLRRELKRQEISESSLDRLDSQAVIQPKISKIPSEPPDFQIRTYPTTPPQPLPKHWLKRWRPEESPTSTSKTSNQGNSEGIKQSELDNPKGHPPNPPDTRIEIKMYWAGGPRLRPEAYEKLGPARIRPKLRSKTAEVTSDTGKTSSAKYEKEVVIDASNQPDSKVDMQSQEENSKTGREKTIIERERKAFLAGVDQIEEQSLESRTEEQVTESWGHSLKQLFLSPWKILSEKVRDTQPTAEEEQPLETKEETESNTTSLTNTTSSSSATSLLSSMSTLSPKATKKVQPRLQNTKPAKAVQPRTVNKLSVEDDKKPGLSAEPAPKDVAPKTEETHPVEKLLNLEATNVESDVAKASEKTIVKRMKIYTPPHLAGDMLRQLTRSAQALELKSKQDTLDHKSNEWWETTSEPSASPKSPTNKVSIPKHYNEDSENSNPPDKAISKQRPLSLFDELFPEESKAQERDQKKAEARLFKLPAFNWNPEFQHQFNMIRNKEQEMRKTSSMIPQRIDIPLPEEDNDTVQYAPPQFASRSPEKVEETKPMPDLQKRTKAVLILRAASKILEETDFFRLGPEGNHIEGWTGGILKVIPSRDTNTLEPLGDYFILFSSEHASRKYLDKVRHLHLLALTHSDDSALLLPAPHSNFQRNTAEEPLSKVLSKFTLLPGYAKLNLRPIAQPYKPSIRALISFGGPADIVSRKAKAEEMVMLTIDWGHITTYDLRDALSDDGKARNLHWKLAGNHLAHENVVRVEYDVAKGRGTELEKEKRRELKGMGARRFIISFGDRFEARRFVREWHMRTFPLRRERTDGRWGEIPPVMRVKALW